jgi:hypothetical protein
VVLETIKSAFPAKPSNQPGSLKVEKWQKALIPDSKLLLRKSIAKEGSFTLFIPEKL